MHTQRIQGVLVPACVRAVQWQPQQFRETALLDRACVTALPTTALPSTAPNARPDACLRLHNHANINTTLHAVALWRECVAKTQTTNDSRSIDQMTNEPSDTNIPLRRLVGSTAHSKSVLAAQIAWCVPRSWSSLVVVVVVVVGCRRRWLSSSLVVVVVGCRRRRRCRWRWRWNSAW